MSQSTWATWEDYFSLRHVLLLIIIRLFQQLKLRAGPYNNYNDIVFCFWQLYRGKSLWVKPWTKAKMAVINLSSPMIYDSNLIVIWPTEQRTLFLVFWGGVHEKFTNFHYGGYILFQNKERKRRIAASIWAFCSDCDQGFPSLRRWSLCLFLFRTRCYLRLKLSLPVQLWISRNFMCLQILSKPLLVQAIP